MSIRQDMNCKQPLFPIPSVLFMGEEIEEMGKKEPSLFLEAGRVNEAFIFFFNYFYFFIYIFCLFVTLLVYF